MEYHKCGNILGYNNMDIKPSVIRQQSNIHDFIDRLFKILESDHEKPFDLLHITMSLFHKYMAISQKKDTSIYEFGTACFALSDLLICNDDGIDYDLIFYLKIHNKDPEKNIKQKVLIKIIQSKINDVLIASSHRGSVLMLELMISCGNLEISCNFSAENVTLSYFPILIRYQFPHILSS